MSIVTKFNIINKNHIHKDHDNDVTQHLRKNSNLMSTVSE